MINLTLEETYEFSEAELLKFCRDHKLSPHVTCALLAYAIDQENKTKLKIQPLV